MGIVIMSGRDIIATGLQNVQAEYLAAVSDVEVARVVRDDAIRDALSAGWTQREVAALLNISPGRVGQIATPKEESDGS